LAKSQAPIPFADGGSQPIDTSQVGSQTTSKGLNW